MMTDTIIVSSRELADSRHAVTPLILEGLPVGRRFVRVYYNGTIAPRPI